MEMVFYLLNDVLLVYVMVYLSFISVIIPFIPFSSQAISEATESFADLWTCINA